MATGANYKQAQVTEVYYPMGRFNHDYGKKRFVRAPFILVKMQPVDDAAWEDYWMPAPIGGSPNSMAGPMRDFLSDDNGDGECRHPFGYVTLQNIIVEQSEMGNVSPILMGESEDNDSWQNFHRIGFI